MENFLLNFANTDTQVQSSNAKLNVSPEFYGTIDITKGLLSMTKNFYARLYKTRYPDIVSLDNWDINETTDVKFSGLPIDSIDALRKSLSDSGLSTLSSGLEITDKDVSIQICLQIQETDAFKTIFGKDAVIMDTLSDNEQNKIRLKFAIDNYDDKRLGNYELGLFSVTNEEGNRPATYGELVEMYNNLNQ